MHASKKPLPGASSTRGSRGTTVVWALIGLLCCAGMILAAVDPGPAGNASGLSLGTSPLVAPSADDDDGFVAPPLASSPEVRTPAAPQVLDQAARDAHADKLIQKLITKMHKEREALRAERKLAREQAQD